MFGRLLLLLLVPLALAGCDRQGAPPHAAKAHPALWAVRDRDTTVYLFGTVHLLPDGTQWIDRRVRGALDASDEIVLELEPGPRPAPAIGKGALAASAPLPAVTDAATMAKVRAELTSHGMSPNALDAAPPWYASVTIANLALVDSGNRTDGGVEAGIAEIADSRGIKVAGLETLNEQFGYFAGLSLPTQRAMLKRAVDTLPGLGTQAKALFDAWKQGDTPAIERLMDADFGATPELGKVLIDTRNAHWADWIAHRMARPGTVFVAVGTGHLVGARGLPSLLAARGYAVTRLPSGRD